MTLDCVSCSPNSSVELPGAGPILGVLIAYIWGGAGLRSCIFNKCTGEVYTVGPSGTHPGPLPERVGEPGKDTVCLKYSLACFLYHFIPQRTCLLFLQHVRKGHETYL